MDVSPGTSTFVFTDVEGSTRLLEDLDTSYGLALRLQRQIVKTRFEAQRGEQIGTEGDGLFWRFPTPTEAVTAALATQERFVGLENSDSLGLRVRMGIHCGPVRLSGGEYIGLTIHEAARVSAAAHGDQILCTDAVRRAAADAPDISFRELGSFLLRSMPHEHTLYEVTRPGDGRRFPPPREAVRAGGPKLTVWRRQPTLPPTVPTGPADLRFETPERGPLPEEIVVEILPATLAQPGAFRLLVRRHGVVEEEYDGLAIGGAADARVVLAAHSDLVRVRVAASPSPD